MYDLCIVGAGLIGSAAARHASLSGQHKICITGPEEPKDDIEISDGRDIFGAHYDEGRMTRKTDLDPVWGHLAQQSIPRYRSIEKEAGIEFYNEVGCMVAGAIDGKLKLVTENAKTHNINVQAVGPSELQSEFPFFQFGPDDHGLYEPDQSGYFSPRRLIKAQLTIAQKNGCDVIHDVVKQIRRTEDDKNEIIMRVVTDQGKSITAKKVLLATGAFTESRDLLEDGRIPDVKVVPLTLAKVEVTAEHGKKFKKMPPLMYYGEGRETWPLDFPRGADGNYAIYMLPAVLYPDGKYYLKLGPLHSTIKQRLHTPDEVSKWFRSKGNKEIAKSSADLICNIVKGIEMLSYHGDSCVIVETPTNRPYIDMVHSQLGVTLGDNGYAAKSSDEIGRIAADLMIYNKWDSSISREDVKLRYRSTESKI